MSAVAEARLEGKLGLGIEMVMEGGWTVPPASLLFRKDDSAKPRCLKKKQENGKLGGKKLKTIRL